MKAWISALAKRVWSQRSVRIAFYVAILVGLLSSALPNQYASQATVLPSDVNAGGVSGLLSAAIGLNLPGLQNTPDQNFETILESRWLGEGVLTQTYEFHLAPFRFMPAKPCRMTLLEYLGEPNLDKGMKALPKVLNIDRNLKTSVVTIETNTRSPELSQQVTNRALDLLEEFLAQHNQTIGREKARFAVQRLKEAEAAADASEDRLRAFLMVNRNYDQSTDPEVRLKGSRLEADLQLRRQVISNLATMREQSLLDEKNDTPLLNILERGNLPVEKSRPHRVLWTILSAILAFLWVFAIDHRAKLKAFLQEEAV